MGRVAKKRLTPQEERFVQEFIARKKAYPSAIAAGYGVSTAKIAYKWVNKPDFRPRVYKAIQEALREELEKKAQELLPVKTLTDAILSEMSIIAYSDLRRLYGPDGKIVHPTEFPPEIAKAVQSFKTRVGDDGREYVTELRFWPKLGALQTLAQIEGLLQGGLGGINTNSVDEELEERFKNAKEKTRVDEQNRLKVVR